MTTRASTRASTRSPASMRPLATTDTAAAAATTAAATAAATAARAHGDRCEREATAGTTATTGDGYGDSGGFGASTEQHGQAISGTTSSTQDELRGCKRPGLRRRRVRSTTEVRGRQKRGRDGAERHRFVYKTVGSELGSPACDGATLRPSVRTVPRSFSELATTQIFGAIFHHGAISSRGNVSGHC